MKEMSQQQLIEKVIIEEENLPFFLSSRSNFKISTPPASSSMRSTMNKPSLTSSSSSSFHSHSDHNDSYFFKDLNSIPLLLKSSPPELFDQYNYIPSNSNSNFNLSFNNNFNSNIAYNQQQQQVMKDINELKVEGGITKSKEQKNWKDLKKKLADEKLISSLEEVVSPEQSEVNHNSLSLSSKESKNVMFPLSFPFNLKINKYTSPESNLEFNFSTPSSSSSSSNNRIINPYPSPLSPLSRTKSTPTFYTYSQSEQSSSNLNPSSPYNPLSAPSTPTSLIHSPPPNIINPFQPFSFPIQFNPLDNLTPTKPSFTSNHPRITSPRKERKKKGKFSSPISNDNKFSIPALNSGLLFATSSLDQSPCTSTPPSIFTQDSFGGYLDIPDEKKEVQTSSSSKNKRKIDTLFDDDLIEMKREEEEEEIEESSDGNERPISMITGLPTRKMRRRSLSGSPRDADRRIFVCAIGNCNKAFARPSALETHKRAHTGNRPFACPLLSCSRPFSVFSNLKRHMITHPEVDFKSVTTNNFPQFVENFKANEVGSQDLKEGEKVMIWSNETFNG